MIVGARQRHDLLDAELAQRGIARVLQARRQRDRAGGDDRTLTGHEPRNRGDRSDAAGIGQRETRAAEFVGDEFVLARFGDELFVRGAELREVERVGPLDDRHDQKARTVFALRVDGQPEVHAVLDLRERRSVAAETRDDRGLLARRAHERERDDVRERNFFGPAGGL